MAKKMKVKDKLQKRRHEFPGPGDFMTYLCFSSSYFYKRPQEIMKRSIHDTKQRHLDLAK